MGGVGADESDGSRASDQDAPSAQWRFFYCRNRRYATSVIVNWHAAFRRRVATQNRGAGPVCPAASFRNPSIRCLFFLSVGYRERTQSPARFVFPINGRRGTIQPFRYGRRRPPMRRRHECRDSLTRAKGARVAKIFCLGGQHNALKRLNSAKEIQGNPSFFL